MVFSMFSRGYTWSLQGISSALASLTSSSTATPATPTTRTRCRRCPTWSQRIRPCSLARWWALPWLLDGFISYIWYIWCIYIYDRYMIYDLSMFVRYVWAFRTRVLKTRVPERAFWVNPFFQWYKVNVFPGFEQRNPFPPLKKKDVELLWAQSCVWSHQKVDLPNSGFFLGEAKKVLASPGLWGKLGFLPGSFFSLKEKGSDPSQILS